MYIILVFIKAVTSLYERFTKFVTKYELISFKCNYEQFSYIMSILQNFGENPNEVVEA